jgi:RNA polymerase sigma factor (sigma-70 family)
MVLVGLAANGDRLAWDQLVDRYAPLVWSICRRYRLTQADADDVSQSVWLRLVENLANLREPQALPGWLATTTSRECLRVVRSGMRERPADELHLEMEVLSDTDPVEQGFVAAELRDALREAYRQLPDRCRDLFGVVDGRPARLLCADQPAAEHAGWWYRAQPCPLPGSAARVPRAGRVLPGACRHGRRGWGA